ncbi:MAG: AAA family ATPase [Anaerolineales bacterium]
MELKPLPVSTSTFRKIIQGGYLYVDKTRYIYESTNTTSLSWTISNRFPRD